MLNPTAQDIEIILDVIVEELLARDYDAGKAELLRIEREILAAVVLH